MDRTVLRGVTVQEVTVTQLLADVITYSVHNDVPWFQVYNHIDQ
jgi:hypothetical protein